MTGSDLQLERIRIILFVDHPAPEPDENEVRCRREVVEG